MKYDALANSLSVLLSKWIVTVSKTGYIEFNICTTCILEIKRFCFGIGFSERPETDMLPPVISSPLHLHFKMGKSQF